MQTLVFNDCAHLTAVLSKVDSLHILTGSNSSDVPVDFEYHVHVQTCCRTEDTEAQTVVMYLLTLSTMSMYRLAAEQKTRCLVCMH